MKINDVIKAKPSHRVVTIGPDATVRELIALLAEHNVGALVVSDDGERVTGIVSERDVVRRLHADADVLETAVSQIMTADVRTCAGDDGLTDLMQTDDRAPHPARPGGRRREADRHHQHR